MIHLLPELIFTVALSAAACGISGCGSGVSDEPSGETAAEIILTPSALSADAGGGVQTVNVLSDADWSATCDADWVRVFPTGGLKGSATDMTVTLGPWAGFDGRETEIVIRSGGKTVSIPVSQEAGAAIELSHQTLACGAAESTLTFTVRSNRAWTVGSGAEWCTVSPAGGEAGQYAVTVRCAANDTPSERETELSVRTGDTVRTVRVVQGTDVIDTPEGYMLVWHDEFNAPDGSGPDMTQWYYDIWPKGYVNNELQRYVAGEYNGERTAEIRNGALHITARKVGDEVVSARLNTRDLWLYGYFEARLKLPKGKGTWPAFWMMPADGGNWPHCGEIDIMEEVGVNPDYTSSSIHCTAYNHTIGTQKTAERLCPGAEEEYHVYALEWTPERITTYVDGRQLFSFANDMQGNQDTWPFDKPFHPILNLAWGGMWGGMNGVDESFLPATYEVDYVRVFQKQ